MVPAFRERSVFRRQSELRLVRGRALPYELCLEPFKISFITHIFHELVHAGPCPAALCAHMLAGESLMDGAAAEFGLNKQAGDDRFGS